MTTTVARESATSPTLSDAQIARRWWRRFIDPSAGEGRVTRSPAGNRAHRPVDPAIRARLRRARHWSDAVAEPAALELVTALGRRGNPDDARVVRALDVARLLAHVKTDSKEALLARAGKKSGNDESRTVAEGRVRRLLQERDAERLTSLLIRLVKQVDGEADVGRLATDLLYWGPAVRTRWAFSYFAGPSAAPPEWADDTPPADAPASPSSDSTS